MRVAWGQGAGEMQKKVITYDSVLWPLPIHKLPQDRQRRVDTISMVFLCPVIRTMEILWNILHILSSEKIKRNVN